MSQILFLAVFMIIILELVELIAQNLMLDFSFLDFFIRFALVAKTLFSEAITVHHFGHFICLFVSCLKLVTSFFSVGDTSFLLHFEI